MKIFSICLTKNESDILEKTLLSGLIFSDAIFVIDNGSNDHTKEIVMELTKQYPQIRYLDAAGWEFQDGLRSFAFNKFGYQLEAGKDWWCRLDSDEQYLDDPRDFLLRVPKWCRSVEGEMYQYYFTEKDIVAYNSDPSQYHQGESTESLHYFSCNSFEIRFVRHGHYNWSMTQNWPSAFFILPTYRCRIRIKHFQYRYPEQIQRRILQRAAVQSAFGHERSLGAFKRIARRSSSTLSDSDPTNWTSRIVPSAHLSHDSNIDAVKSGETLSEVPRFRRQLVSMGSAFIKLGLSRFRSSGF